MPELERAKLPHVPNLAGSNWRDLQSDHQVHGRTLVSRLGSEARRWAKFRRTIQDGSSELGCSRDQEQSRPTATTPIARATRAVRSNFAGRVIPNSAQNSMLNNSQSDTTDFLYYFPLLPHITPYRMEELWSWASESMVMPTVAQRSFMIAEAKRSSWKIWRGLGTEAHRASENRLRSITADD